MLVNAVRALPFVRVDPSPDCILQDFEADAALYSIRYWIDDFPRGNTYDSERAQRRLVRGPPRAGMEIPFLCATST